jgi:hypothetical protein
MRPEISVLRSLFEVDPATGVIARCARPESDFSALRHWRMWNVRYAGKPAGCVRSDGYVMVRVIIDGKKYDILGHILVWALHHGRWPMDELDHRDGVGHHNWIDNLREATRQEQMQNMRPGKRGTGFDARDGRWNARIRANGKILVLGRFDTEEAAHRAYLEAKRRLHTFQPVPRA